MEIYLHTPKIKCLVTAVKGLQSEQRDTQTYMHTDATGNIPIRIREWYKHKCEVNDRVTEIGSIILVVSRIFICDDNLKFRCVCDRSWRAPAALIF